MYQKDTSSNDHIIHNNIGENNKFLDSWGRSFSKKPRNSGQTHCNNNQWNKTNKDGTVNLNDQHDL